MTLGFRDAVEGVTIPLRLTTEGSCATCRGSGARPGTSTHTCATCHGSGQVSRSAGAGFAFAEPCRECQGRGVVIDDPCPTCQGTGRGTSTRTISARLPAGVADGARIRLKGKGSPGEQGAPNGDLYIQVKVTPHAVFGRRGQHLTITVPGHVPGGGARRGDPRPHPERGAGDAADPGRHDQRPHVPGQGQGHRPRRRVGRRPAGHRRGRRPAEGRRRGPQGARDLPRRDQPTTTRAPACSTRRSDEREETPDERAVRPHRRLARLRHLDRGADQRHARADPAPVRPARPGLARPHARWRPALLPARHRPAPRGPAAVGRGRQPRGHPSGAGPGVRAGPAPVAG